ncbi:MAG: hypothetical protein ACTHML_12740 [Ginsengibacter sp.]
MRDRKYFFLLIFVLIIITISFVLISIWGYHFYYSDRNDQPLVRHEIKAAPHTHLNNDSLAYINSQNDYSLLENFAYETDTSGDSVLIAKILAYRRLRSEIEAILIKRHSGEERSGANRQILELEKDIEELKNKNDTIIRENERLNNLVTELLHKKEVAKNEPAEPRVSNQIEHAAIKLPLLVSHLRFAAYDVDKNQAATNVATDAEKLTGSFQVNINPYNTNHSVYVVVVQPNGKVLTAGKSLNKTFNSQSGKKLYSAVIHFDNKSAVIHFDNKKDNGARLSFSIDVTNLQKGKYVMQIYHQGVMIGRLTKTLF